MFRSDYCKVFLDFEKLSHYQNHEIRRTTPGDLTPITMKIYKARSPIGGL